MEQVQQFDRQKPPVQTVREGRVVRSENGQLQIVMNAPLIVKYDDPEERTVYPKGVEITFYDEQRQPKAFFTAGQAVSYDTKDCLHAYDSVVVIDYRSNDTTYLQDIVWDSEQKRIYSDYPLRSVNGKRVTYGDRFESDENFEHPQIFNQRGTVEWEEETAAEEETIE